MSLNEILQNPQFPVIQRQIHWLSCAVDEFDPKTGDALPLKLSDFLWHILEIPQEKVCRDRIWKIAAHAAPPLHRLFRSLTEAPRRVHASMPAYKVRELDVNSFVKISLRPGRNIREKLSSTLNIEAVDRVQSVDLTENRLLKEFVIQFSNVLDLLNKVQKSFGMSDEIKELYSEMQNWLRSDDAKRIGKWTNLPPNNALLSHREYQCIWDAWGWLQTLERDLDNDMKFIKQRQKMIDYWTAVANCKLGQDVHFAEMPITIDYDSFIVKPWSANGVQLRVNNQPLVLTEDNYKTQKVGFSQKRQKSEFQPVDKPVCVDLTAISPAYTVEDGMNRLSDRFIWQEWSDSSSIIDLKLFDADAVWLHNDAVTVTSQDVFFSKSHKSEHLRKAADAFTSQLRTYFKNDALIWLVPDYLNDFDLEALRSSINAKFPNAHPLPRSVAAVFENLDKLPSGKKELSVLVLDSVGGVPCATRLTGTFSKELFKKAPETKGFVWRRHPSYVIKTHKNTVFLPPEMDLLGVDNKWYQEKAQAIPSIKSKDFVDEAQISKSDREIKLSQFDQPVIGGIRLYNYQKRLDNIDLWQDNLPDLSIGISVNGRNEKFYLVKDEKIQPKRGSVITISIDKSNTFKLPSGVACYKFPLYQGKKYDQLNYFISLESPLFPLDDTLSCQLEMTYTYGIDQPYKLIFIPVDKDGNRIESMPSIQAKWKPSTEEYNSLDISQLPIPSFPPVMNWDRLQNFLGKNGNIIDLLDWVESVLLELQNNRSIDWDNTYQRKEGIITYRGKSRKTDKAFFWAKCNGISVRCSEEDFIEEISESSPTTNDSLYFDISVSEDGKDYIGVNVSYSVRYPNNLLKPDGNPADDNTIRVNDVIDRLDKLVFKMRFPALTIWAGHSLQEPWGPPHFRDCVYQSLDVIKEIVYNESASAPLRDNLLFFLCCMHKDAPDFIQVFLNNIIEDRDSLKKYCNAIAFSLGDAGLQWQLDLLQKIIQKIKRSSAVGNYLKILSIALWRSESLLFLLTFDQLTTITNALVQNLRTILKSINNNEKQLSYELCSNLELLLALIRTRKSSDNRIQRLFIPNNEISNSFIDLLYDITETVINKKYELRSRINLQIKKPKAFSNTPDLLYALRLYLTGDSGANTIVVESVDDDD